MQLRPYQQNMVDAIRSEWDAGARNVCAVLPAGGGKTVTFGTILREHTGASVAIAHRRELVGQMSTTLARMGVRHRIIAPNETIREIVTLHVHEVGHSMYDPRASCAVAGVHTLGRRDLGSWASQVTLWVTDESHHLLAKNLWGRGLELFPNARGLGVTATPLRADGNGLGRTSDGLMDALIVGPSMRDLITEGYLTDYRIFAPKSDIDLSHVPVTASGDFSPAPLREAAKQSHVTGDIVDNYLRIAPGKLGVTFAVSVDLAQETAARFRAAGVPAECVSANTPDLVRAHILRRFANREILQLVNVDLFGEGFDLPAIEVVSMGRPTESYGLYVQQFGRACRPMKGKDRAIIIDHVGNVMRHGLPDTPRQWSLDRRERRKSNAEREMLVKACPQCTGVYERFYKACPYCGYVPVPVARSAPHFVDGDLHELDATVLAVLRGEAKRLMNGPLFPAGATPAVRGAIVKQHELRKTAQTTLRDRMAWWGGWQNYLGRDDSEAYRRFFLTYGTDVATAQTLGAREATELADRIRVDLSREGIVT